MRGGDAGCAGLLGTFRGPCAWTLRLLGDKLVELEIVDSIYKETVRKALKKGNLKPWRKQCWRIPPKASAEFVFAMEDVLEVYYQEFDEDSVLVCMDETSKQQTKETRTPRPVSPPSSTSNASATASPTSDVRTSLSFRELLVG